MSSAGIFCAGAPGPSVRGEGADGSLRQKVASEGSVNFASPPVFPRTPCSCHRVRPHDGRALGRAARPSERTDVLRLTGGPGADLSERPTRLGDEADEHLLALRAPRNAACPRSPIARRAFLGSALADRARRPHAGRSAFALPGHGCDLCAAPAGRAAVCLLECGSPHACGVDHQARYPHERRARDRCRQAALERRAPSRGARDRRRVRELRQLAARRAPPRFATWRWR